MKNLIVKSIAAIAIFASSLTFAVDEVYVDANGVTLAGYDAVAYFTENKAVKGKSKFTAVHNNAIYKFSSEANRDAFKSNPSKYEPAYGGYCAYGAALGKKLDIDGKAFKVVDGKLYVNKNLEIAGAWVKDEANLIAKADQEWPGIEATPASELQL